MRDLGHPKTYAWRESERMKILIDSSTVSQEASAEVREADGLSLVPMLDVEEATNEASSSRPGRPCHITLHT